MNCNFSVSPAREPCLGLRRGAVTRCYEIASPARLRFPARVQRLPEAFLRDYEQLRERQRWLRPDPEAEMPVPTARQLVAELDDFLRRWQAQVHIPPIRQKLDELRPEVTRLQTHLCELRRVDHWELLEARLDWLLAVKLIAVSVHFIGVMKEAPPQARPELEKIYREHMGHDFEPEREFRDTTAEADKCEAAFHQAWRDFQENWPEDAIPAFQQRLMQDDLEALKAWQREFAGPAPVTTPARQPES